MEREGHQNLGTKVPKTYRTELILAHSGFIIFEKGVILWEPGESDLKIGSFKSYNYNLQNLS